MRARHPMVLALATLAMLSAAGCGGGSGGGPTGAGGQNPPPTGQPPGQQPPPSNSTQIAVKNNRFDPSSTTVSVGTTVTWTWDACAGDGYGGQTCVEHNVTFDGSGTGSATQSTGTYTRAFSAAGTFTYRCTNHTGMNGQVTVQ
jgi:plastocyanin